MTDRTRAFPLTADRWLWRVVVAGMVLIPLVVSIRSNDPFRLPKEVLFRAEAIVILVILAVLIALGYAIRRPQWRDLEFALPAAAVLWAGATTLTSTNQMVSLEAFLWIAGWAVIFVTTTVLARSRSISAVYALLAPAIVNAVILLLQEASVWNPFFPDKPVVHTAHTGLIGNPNYFGTFVVAPLIAAAALFLADRTKRLLSGGTFLLLLVTAVANHTATALIAVIAGVVAIAFLVSRRWFLITAVAAPIALGTLIAFYPPLRERYENTRIWATTGGYDAIVSGRVPAFLAAWQMFRDRPVVGVGPGCFKWEYFPYRLKVDQTREQLVAGASAVNFGEVHSDHLQILAEAGLPAYVIFATALFAIGSVSFRARQATVEGEFSRIASMPLAIGLAVLALAQFPLELAASAGANLYLFALCYAWRRPSA